MDQGVDCIEIEAFFEPLPGASQAFKLGATDGALYAIKFREKAQAGALSLARELLAPELALAVDVSVPPARVVCLTQAYLDIEPRLVFSDGSRPAPGLACGSRFMPPDQGLPDDHSARLAMCPVSDIAGVLVFNTWVGCDDRGWHNYAFGIEGRSPRFASIDYATAFNRAESADPQVHDVDEVRTAATSSWSDVESALGRLDALSDAAIDDATTRIPSEFWATTERDSVAAMLRASKPKVRTVIERLKP